MKSILVPLLLVLLVSCSRKEPEKRSATSGDLVLAVTKEYADLVDTLANEFARQYTEIRPSVRPMQTREAIVGLLNDSVSTICIDREFNDEEMRVMQDAEMSFTPTRIAWDALVAVVNSANRTPRFTREGLSSIVSGGTARWDDVPGSGRSGPIEFVTTGRNTGLYENILTTLAAAGEDLKVFAVGDSQEECVTFVGRSPGAIALVSLRAARDLPQSVRTVPLRTLVDSTAKKYVDIFPSQTSVYTGEYGLRHGIFIVTTERRSLTGSGFSTFLLRTQAQKIVQKSGLLPALIPSRVIQLTSE